MILFLNNLVKSHTSHIAEPIIYVFPQTRIICFLYDKNKHIDQVALSWFWTRMYEWSSITKVWMSLFSDWMHQEIIRGADRIPLSGK